MKYLTVAPYYKYYFWRSDGTANGTVRVADSLVNASSFTTLNNKMYGAVMGDALWETDVTAAGTKKLLKGIINYPFILNNTIFFSNWGNGTGYELWSYTASTSGIPQLPTYDMDVNIFPNPSNGHFQLKMVEIQSLKTEVEIYNMTGERVHTATIQYQQNTIDISDLIKGIYFVKINDGTKVSARKVIVQ